MAEGSQVRALYDFDAQPGTGELSIWQNEVLTVTRQDVGEGWWEGTNTRGETGLFPAGYVEVISSQPPAFAPPPPPPPSTFQPPPPPASTTNANPGDYNANQNYAEDDWDDDWDDDESSYSGQQGIQNQPVHSVIEYRDKGETVPGQMGNVPRSFRFSSFAKLGGNDFIFGQTKVNDSTLNYVMILDTGRDIIWSPSSQTYTCTIASPKKESKLKGLKSYIAYQITTSNFGLQVSRRYKHFDWLHKQLEEKFTIIPIAPLPDKQISGRYEEGFIGQRMTQLQMWVNRICRHPVLSESEVWKHFVTCTDEKKWKTGKRKAEHDESNFLMSIKPPDAPLELSSVERQTEAFAKFSEKMDESVKQLYSTVQEEIKKCLFVHRKDFQRRSLAFHDLGVAFEQEPVPYSPELAQAVLYTGEAYDEIGKYYEEQPKYDFEPLIHVLHEYKGLLGSWKDITHFHKSAISKKKEVAKMKDDGKLNTEEERMVHQRIDVISYATLAEITQFQNERVHDFKNVMTTYLHGQVNMYLKIVKKLQDCLVKFESL